MGIKTIPQPPYSPEVAPCDFWLFPKLRVCRYETIEEMKEGVTKVVDTLTQEEFHEAFQKLLEGYKCIESGGDYFKGDKSFISVLSIKVPIRKKSENLFNDPRTNPNIFTQYSTQRRKERKEEKDNRMYVHVDECTHTHTHTRTRTHRQTGQTCKICRGPKFSLTIYNNRIFTDCNL